MPSINQVICALGAVGIASVNAAFGPAFSTGPVASNSFIRESTSTLVLPQLPTNNKGDLSLWVGMGTSNGDLIQSIAENYGTSSWEVYAYTLLSTGPTSQFPVQGPSAAAAAADQITMHYVYSDTTQNYTQTVTKNGVVVSTLSTSDAHAQGWGSAVECAATDCGTVPAHTWINTKIIMDVADPNYINTLGKSAGVTGNLVTADGGKTWTVSTISIPQFTFS